MATNHEKIEEKFNELRNKMIDLVQQRLEVGDDLKKIVDEMDDEEHKKYLTDEFETIMEKIERFVEGLY